MDLMKWNNIEQMFLSYDFNLPVEQDKKQYVQ